VNITYSLDASEWIKTLSALEQNVDPRNILQQAAEIIRSDVIAQFQSGGIPSWKPLATSTIRQKRAAGYPRHNQKGEEVQSLKQNGVFGPENILIRSGALFSSWTQKQDPDHIEEIDGDTLTFGSSLDYAAYHQTGSGRGLPARPITITEDAMRKIEAIVGSEDN
jgi:phage gpG-like protein